MKAWKVKGDVVAESRGGNEDTKLKNEYRRIYDNGTRYHPKEFFQNTLTSKEIKIKPKIANIGGIQVADLIAFPSKQRILLEEKEITESDISQALFGTKVC